MSDAPFFSIVVPTYNRIDTLRRVLTALDGQSGAPSFELIVIDDGSGDETAAVMQHESTSGHHSYPIRFHTQENSGPGKARNRGASLAAGRYVVFIGDDTVPEERFLAEHHRTHEESGGDPMLACLGYTGWPPGERVTAFMHYINDYGLQFGYRLIHDGEIVPFNFFYTSNISMERNLVQQHPFDTSFPAAAWEDIELAYRLDAKGLKIRYNARAITRHFHPMSVESFARRQYTVGKSGAIFARKHPELSHFLGIAELEEKGVADEKTLSRLRRRARLGEKFSFLARNEAFERLMRQHYLRGLRDGLAGLEG
ncbi:MAG: glycosyltransferase [Thermoanaerobaculia bacterium]